MINGGYLYLYLADGEPKQLLGQSEVKYTLHGKTWRQSTPVLYSETLAWPYVLGLDFLFQSGMQMDISNNAYWFKTNEQEQFHFLTEISKEQEPTLHCEFFVTVASSSLSLTPDGAFSELFRQVIQDVHLDQSRNYCKTMLMSAPHSWVTLTFSTRSCYTRCTNSTKPYHVSPPKLQVMKRLIDKMLSDDIIKPSSSAWAAPVVIPKNTGVDARFCVDFRKLNSDVSDVTLDDAYPL